MPGLSYAFVKDPWLRSELELLDEMEDRHIEELLEKEAAERDRARAEAGATAHTKPITADTKPTGDDSSQDHEAMTDAHKRTESARKAANARWRKKRVLQSRKEG
jgi:hypothetical protein